MLEPLQTHHADRLDRPAVAGKLEAACGSAREAVMRLAAERAQVEAWTSALAHLCQTGFSGHKVDATGTCTRCGSAVNHP